MSTSGIHGVGSLLARGSGTGCPVAMPSLEFRRPAARRARPLDIRRLFKNETLGGHVPHPWSGQPRHGAAVDSDFQGKRHHRLAAEPAGVWETRFCLSKTQTRRVRRRMLLARVSQACDLAEEQCRVLAEKDRGEPLTGQARQPDAPRSGLAGRTDLGA